MAYGFGATFGTNGDTDRIVASGSTYTPSTAMTHAIWAYRHGDGGNSAGRMWATGDPNFGIYLASKYYYRFEFSGTDGDWSCPSPSTDAWHHVAVVGDFSSSANDPLIYIDGASQTVTRQVAPTGSLVTNPLPMRIGNETVTTNHAWDGMLADLAVWNTQLSAAQVGMLAAGYTADQVQLASLALYWPLLGTASERVAGTSSSVTGALVQPTGPRLVSPRLRPTRAVIPAAPPAGSAAHIRADARDGWRGSFRGQHRAMA